MLAAQLQGASNHGEQLVMAQYTIGHLKDLWCNAMKLKYAGYTAKTFRAAGHMMEHANSFATRPNDGECNGMHVNEAGWSADKLKHDGCIIAELQDAGDSGAHIVNAECTIGHIKHLWCKAVKLSYADCTARPLAQDLHIGGFTGKRLQVAE